MEPDHHEAREPERHAQRHGRLQAPVAPQREAHEVQRLPHVRARRMTRAAAASRAAPRPPPARPPPWEAETRTAAAAPARRASLRRRRSLPRWSADAARSRPSQRGYSACRPDSPSEVHRSARSAPDTNAAPRAQQHLGQRDGPKLATRVYASQPTIHRVAPMRERPAATDPIGQVAGRKLEDDHRHAEQGLRDHDVGQRHPDLVLPEQRDDGNREEGALQGRVGEEKARVQGFGSRVPTFFLSSSK